MDKKPNELIVLDRCKQQLATIKDLPTLLEVRDKAMAMAHYLKTIEDGKANSNYRQGDALQVLSEMPSESVHCCVTSPPYWGLRDYGTATWEGGDEGCDHEGSDRYYTEQTAAVGSADAFSKPGQANAERLKKGRWREGGVCVKCGAEHRDKQLGLEATPEEYVAKMVEVFREVRRVLRDDGTLWLNLGDSYAGPKGNTAMTGGKSDPARGRAMFGDLGKSQTVPPGLKPKDLCGIPWRVAFALQADGWWLRQDIIWAKPNPMPESVTDRTTKSHEYIFLLSKSSTYYYDAEAIREPHARLWDAEKNGGSLCGTDNRDKAVISGHGRANRKKSEPNENGRNKRSVWTVTTQPYKNAHFATFPPELITPCILAGCPEGGTVLDPFIGSGTTAQVARKNGCSCIGIEINPEYVELANKRLEQRTLI